MILTHFLPFDLGIFIVVGALIALRFIFKALYGGESPQAKQRREAEQRDRKREREEFGEY